MRKYLFLALALVALAGAAVAESTFDPDVQVRYRFESSGRDFDAGTGHLNFNLLRTRIGLKYSDGEDIFVFAQLQDSRVMGSETGTIDGSADAFDLHQGYMKINNLFEQSLRLRIGRFEQNYGAQRLIGAVDWVNIGRSFDGVVLTPHWGEGSNVDLFYYAEVDSLVVGERGDKNVFGAYSNLEFSDMHTTEVFAIWQRAVPKDRLNRITVGAYLKGNIAGLQYASDLAWQGGDVTPDSVVHDISAYMVTLDLWWEFKDTKGKPGILGGVDYLSGDDDLTDSTTKVFNTLYATNHKFYGYMDYFLSIPLNTYGRGLVDMHGKAWASWGKSKFLLAFHVFQAQQDYILATSTPGDIQTSKSFGSEVDFTYKYPYRQKLGFVAGVSTFSPGDIFKETRGGDQAWWGYLMITANL
jgi:hypothetical protein